MAQIAEKVIEENGFTSKIKVVGKRSTDLLIGKGFCIKISPSSHLSSFIFHGAFSNINIGSHRS